MVLGLILALAVSTQTQAAPDPSHDLDFWVGEWNCSGRSRTGFGKDEWTETNAANSVHHILGEKVIEENFKMEGFTGKSVSVYSVRLKGWRQTWVDDSGNYLPFEGGKTDEGFVFKSTLPASATGGATTRMVFHDVEKDSFVWDWERSTDGGKTWELEWRLNYKRKK